MLKLNSSQVHLLFHTHHKTDKTEPAGRAKARNAPGTPGTFDRKMIRALIAMSLCFSPLLQAAEDSFVAPDVYVVIREYKIPEIKLLGKTSLKGTKAYDVRKELMKIGIKYMNSESTAALYAPSRQTLVVKQFPSYLEEMEKILQKYSEDPGKPLRPIDQKKKVEPDR